MTGPVVAELTAQERFAKITVAMATVNSPIPTVTAAPVSSQAQTVAAIISVKVVRAGIRAPTITIALERRGVPTVRVL